MSTLAMDEKRQALLLKRLRKRFANPRDAAKALGIDARLLSPRMAFDGAPFDQHRDAMGKPQEGEAEDDFSDLSEDELGRVDKVIDHLKSHYEDLGEDDENELRRLAAEHVRAHRDEEAEDRAGPANGIEAGVRGKAMDAMRKALGADRVVDAGGLGQSRSVAHQIASTKRLARDARSARRIDPYKLFPEAKRIG